MIFSDGKAGMVFKMIKYVSPMSSSITLITDWTLQLNEVTGSKGNEESGEEEGW